MGNKDISRRKSFWRRPEGITGAIFLGGLAIGIGFLAFLLLPYIPIIIENTLYLSLLIVGIGAILYMILDPRMRNLIWYMYKSVMRWITGLFVKVDPIGVLKSYVDHLRGNLKRMNAQINMLRGQMHKLRETIIKNNKAIQSNLELASKAKASNDQSIMILKSRKAGRLRDSNMRLEDLYRKMEVMYRVLTKMYQNSSILVEDIQDQLVVKEQERKVIHASHSAMKSAMSIISGDPDRRAMFDMAMEAVAEDVGQKVGEMERFMEVSANFMDSIDLQNGVFEEEGLKMLEKWENEGNSLLLGEEKEDLLSKANDDLDVLDINTPIQEPLKEGRKNQYDSFFDLDD